MWKDHGNPLITTGMDGYKGQTGESVVNFTETAIGKSAFAKCVDPAGSRQNAKFYADEMKQIMQDRATSRGMEVEKSHAGCVADNTTTNMAAFRRLKNEFPKLLFAGCAAHVTDLLSKDLFDKDHISLLKQVVKDVKFCVKYVKNHASVKNKKPGTVSTK